MSTWADMGKAYEGDSRAKEKQKQINSVNKVELPKKSQLMFPSEIKPVQESEILAMFISKQAKSGPQSAYDGGRNKKQGSQANRKKGTGNKFGSVVHDSPPQTQVQPQQVPPPPPPPPQQSSAHDSSSKFAAYRPSSDTNRNDDNNSSGKPAGEGRPKAQRDEKRDNRSSRQRGGMNERGGNGDNERKRDDDNERGRNEDNERKRNGENERKRKEENDIKKEEEASRQRHEGEARRIVEATRTTNSAEKGDDSDLDSYVPKKYGRELKMLKNCDAEDELRELVKAFKDKHSQDEYNKFFDYVYGCNDFKHLRNRLYSASD